MKFRFLLLLFLFVAPTSAQNAVLRAGTVIYAHDGSTTTDQKITVIDGKIASIDTWSGAMSDDVIDLSDSYIMAGLIDAHAPHGLGS